MFFDFPDPSPDERHLVLVNIEMLRQAERLIESCEQCNADAEIPFDWILDRETGNLGSETDYILEPQRSARTAGGTFWKRRWSSLPEFLKTPGPPKAEA